MTDWSFSHTTHSNSSSFNPQLLLSLVNLIIQPPTSPQSTQLSPPHSIPNFLRKKTFSTVEKVFCLPSSSLGTSHSTCP